MITKEAIAGMSKKGGLRVVPMRIRLFLFFQLNSTTDLA